jgi:hypothetical protein
MGVVSDSQRVSEGARAFNQAVDVYKRLRGADIRTAEYLEDLSRVISSCQKAISLDCRNGDAHVLLANAFYLLHVAIYPMTRNEFPLRLAAATIQHWCDQPAGQPPWTRDVDTGCRTYEVIARTLSGILPECADCEEREMRCLEAELYPQALIAGPHEWMAV